MHWGKKIRNIRETAFFTELKLQKEASSPAGNRTPVSRVTGGDTHHYTTEDANTYWLRKGISLYHPIMVTQQFTYMCSEFSLFSET